MTDWRDPLEKKWVKHLKDDRFLNENLVLDSREVGASSPLVVDTEKGRLAFALLVAHARDQFEKTRNPIYAIEAFMFCHSAGVYPPISVLNWLDEALTQYYKSDGSDNLVKLLGLANERGHNAIAEHKRKSVSLYYADEISLLVRTFGISIGDAALMVQAREQEQGHDAPEASWLEEQYRKRWKKEIDHNIHIPTEKGKKAYLVSFPVGTYPSELKKPKS